MECGGVSGFDEDGKAADIVLVLTAPILKGQIRDIDLAEQPRPTGMGILGGGYRGYGRLRGGVNAPDE